MTLAERWAVDAELLAATPLELDAPPRWMFDDDLESEDEDARPANRASFGTAVVCDDPWITQRAIQVFEEVAELHQRERETLHTRAEEILRRYNPLQPRDPGGEDGGQWIDTRPGDGGLGAGKRLTADDFVRRGETDTFSMIDGAARRLADVWDPSEADLDAWIAEERTSGYYAAKSLKDKREGLAQSTLRKWQGSSGGPVATTAITAVADRLGADYDLMEGEQGPQDYIRGRPELRRPIESFGEVMYAQTQAWFAERGITHVQVKRVTFRGADEDDRRPFTSWSAEGVVGYVGEQTGSTERHETVPVERVFSIPPTGFGTLAETEFVLLPPLPGHQKGENPVGPG